MKNLPAKRKEAQMESSIAKEEKVKFKQNEEAGKRCRMKTEK